jgi:HSP20 family molecular chaperone IbpA
MWAEACAMIERAEQLHRQFFQPGATAAAPSWEPPIDVFERGSELSIYVALPGVEARDIDVTVQPDLLLVTGVRRLPAVARGGAIHRLELPHGRFERRIPLSAAQWQLDQSELVNGCLHLSLTNRR